MKGRSSPSWQMRWDEEGRKLSSHSITIFPGHELSQQDGRPLTIRKDARWPQAAAEQLLIYGVRCTMYDLDYSAPEARGSESDRRP